MPAAGGRARWSGEIACISGTGYRGERAGPGEVVGRWLEGTQVLVEGRVPRGVADVLWEACGYPGGQRGGRAALGGAPRGPPVGQGQHQLLNCFCVRVAATC